MFDGKFRFGFRPKKVEHQVDQPTQQEEDEKEIESSIEDSMVTSTSEALQQEKQENREVVSAIKELNLETQDLEELKEMMKQRTDILRKVQDSTQLPTDFREDWPEGGFKALEEMQKTQGKVLEIGGPSEFKLFSYKELEETGKEVVISNVDKPGNFDPYTGEKIADQSRKKGVNVEDKDFNRYEDGRNLSYGDGELGVVMYSNIPFDIREEVADEAHRVLEDGGLLVIQGFDLGDIKNTLQNLSLKFRLKQFLKSEDTYNGTVVLEKIAEEERREILTPAEQKIYNARFEIEDRYAIEKILQEGNISELYNLRTAIEELVRRKHIGKKDLTVAEQEIYQQLPEELKNLEGKRSLDLELEKLAQSFLDSEQLLGRFRERNSELLEQTTIPAGEFSIISVAKEEDELFQRDSYFSEDPLPGAKLDYLRFKGQYNINANVISFVDKNGCVWVGRYSEETLKSVEDAGYTRGGFGVPYSNDGGIWMRENFDKYLAKTQRGSYEKLTEEWEPVKRWQENKQNPEYQGALTLEEFLKVFNKIDQAARKELVSSAQREIIRFYGELIVADSEQREAVLKRFQDINLEQLTLDEFQIFFRSIKGDEKILGFFVEKMDTKILAEIPFAEFKNFFVARDDSEIGRALLYKMDQETLNTIFGKLACHSFHSFVSRIEDKDLRELLISKIDFKTYLYEETVDEYNLDFLTNVISLKDGAEEGIQKQAIEWIQNREQYPEILQQKGALLLIGFGMKLNQLTDENIEFFATTFYGTQKTKIEIDDIALNDNYLAVAKEKNMSIGRYLSVLISIKQNYQKDSSKSQDEYFSLVVDEQEKIANKPFLKGEHFLPIVHEKEDVGVNFSDPSDVFSPQPFLKIAEANHLTAPTEVPRFDRDSTSKEQLLELIATAPQDTVLFMGMHGKKGRFILSKEEDVVIEMDEFMESVAKAEGISQIVFLSCYSDYNAKEILERWPSEKAAPLILSSSNFNSPTMKVAFDAWNHFASSTVPKFQAENKTPTWNDFWDNLEGRLMILGDKKHTSDPTIHLPREGKELVIG